MVGCHKNIRFGGPGERWALARIYLLGWEWVPPRHFTPEQVVQTVGIAGIVAAAVIVVAIVLYGWWDGRNKPPF